MYGEKESGYSLPDGLDGLLVLHAQLDERDGHHDGRAAQPRHAVHRHRRLGLVGRSGKHGIGCG